MLIIVIVNRVLLSNIRKTQDSTMINFTYTNATHQETSHHNTDGSDEAELINCNIKPTQSQRIQSQMKFTTLALACAASLVSAAWMPTEYHFHWFDAEGGVYDGYHVGLDDSHPDHIFLQEKDTDKDAFKFYEYHEGYLESEGRNLTIDGRTGAVQLVPKWCSPGIYSKFKECQPKRFTQKDGYLCLDDVCDFKGCKQLNDKVILLADFGECSDSAPLKVKLTQSGAVA